jgi:predicted deacylase
MASLAGVKEKGWIEFKYRNTGEPIRFPVGTVHGITDGPTLVVLGGMHGSEFCGIEAAIRLFNEVDPRKLKGTLKVGTIYNLPAFVNNLGFLVPHDGKNPMSTFPGTPLGTYGEAMAYYFDQAVLSQADYFVELHGGDIPEALTPFTFHLETGDPRQDAEAKAMSMAYNIPYVIRDTVPNSQQPPNYAFGLCAWRGKPAILAESGQQGILDPNWTNVHLTGLRNILVHLGMMEGTVVNTVKRSFLANYTSIRSEIEGMWYPCVKLNQMVKPGQVVGVLRDYFGQDVMEIKAKVDGPITVIRTSPNTRIGSVLIEHGDLAGQEA